jgi:hypothetical protein
MTRHWRSSTPSIHSDSTAFGPPSVLDNDCELQCRLIVEMRGIIDHVWPERDSKV